MSYRPDCPKCGALCHWKNLAEPVCPACQPEHPVFHTPPTDRACKIAIAKIHRILDGNEWDSETIEHVARVLTDDLGYVIREPDNEEDTGDDP